MRLDAETIPALLSWRARHEADRQAIVTTDDALTYAELDDGSRTTAACLVESGVVKGDRVALLAPNGIQWAVVAYAVLRIGAVLVPLSTLLRPPELLAELKRASVSHLITTPSFRGRQYLDDLEVAAPGVGRAVSSRSRHAELPSLRRIWATDELPDVPAPTGVVQALEDRVMPADDLAILFTSGSRDVPKGVIHTHGAALRAVAAGLDVRCVAPGERLYIPMPFFWTGGFSQGLLTGLVAGATLLTEAEPEPSRTLRFLERERVTLFRGWPDQAAQLAADPEFASADLSSLKDASLGSVLPPERRPAPGARANLFGMTETFGPYCGDRLDLDMPPAKFGSCGRPFDGVEVRIVDPETQALQSRGDLGEICVRSRNLFRGMCGRVRSSMFSADGFYRTGDLGRLDTDGYLWYAGRVDDMVKVKGATVYPSEVEAALRTLDVVRQAYVTDVAGTDGRREIAALVVTDATVEAVRSAVRDRLSAFKLPTRWLVTTQPDQVPMLASGKVDKAALQQVLASAPPSTA